ncbi:hypothetical protein NE237_030212 [Protea cynaroides]|uniref:Uncharacterized protein n=1 Tax=Protea cynaroides TaxID=273540 RepID=A0A9Q0GVR5_9MAGN|nr:hypothetical protein NE237_030212 [Protea cynaroides]
MPWDPAQADTGVPIWLYPDDLVRDFEIIKLIWFEAKVLQARMEVRKWIVRLRKKTGADPDDALIVSIEIYDSAFFEAEVSKDYPYRFFLKAPKSILLLLRDLGFIFFPKIQVYTSLLVREMNINEPSCRDDLKKNDLCGAFFYHIDGLLDFRMEDTGGGGSGRECYSFRGACWPPMVEALTESTNTVLSGRNGDNTAPEYPIELSVPLQPLSLPDAMVLIIGLFLLTTAQVMNFLKTLIIKMLKERGDSVVETDSASPLEPSDENGHHSPSQLSMAELEAVNKKTSKEPGKDF